MVNVFQQDVPWSLRADDSIDLPPQCALLPLETFRPFLGDGIVLAGETTDQQVVVRDVGLGNGNIFSYRFHNKSPKGVRDTHGVSLTLSDLQQPLAHFFNERHDKGVAHDEIALTLRHTGVSPPVWEPVDAFTFQGCQSALAPCTGV